MAEFRNLPPIYQDHQNIDINITILSSEKSEKYEMILRGVGGTLRRKIDLLPNDLYQLNERMKKKFRAIAFSGTYNQVLLREIAEEGYYAFLRIFSSKDIRDGFLQLLSFSKNAIIEIKTEDFFYPWELLYLKNIKENVSINNFLGAKYIISRLIDLGDWPFIPPYIYQSIPKIGLLSDNNLQYVREKEIPFFESLDANSEITLYKMRILDPDNKQNGLQAFEIFLTNSLDIAHFACHSNNNKKDHNLSNIVISNEFEITLRDLIMLASLQFANKPIVVLNACGTGNVDSYHASFFAKEFLKFGARGVIATDCEIPDKFAAEFTEQFYSRFLDGKTIGSSLFETRRYFIDEQNSLTPLIYSMYAIPMIRIEKGAVTVYEGDY